jgi:hypothetical protein
MAKSHILKQAARTKVEREVQLRTVETVADIFSTYVKQWQQGEIKRLINNNELPLVPVKNGLQVGKHRVLEHSSRWGLFNSHSELVDMFTTKKAAVLYSMLYQSKRFKSADEILDKDKRLNKLEADFQHYDYTMRRATKRKDYSTIDVVASRYYDAKIMLDHARNDLEKTLRMNKYLKVWETGKPL